MNVFWLFSTLLLWNVLSVVRGRFSSDFEVGKCDAESSPPTEIFMDNKQFTFKDTDKHAIQQGSQIQIPKKFLVIEMIELK